MSVTDQYDDIARCNKCGFCQAACPVFRASGDEAGVARGRIALLRALIEKRIDWTKDLEGPLFNCLRCGACTANCFPAVATSDLLADARAEYLDKVGRNPIHRLLFNRLLPHPRRLRLAAKAVALGKRSGLSKLAAALGMLRAIGRDASRAEGIVEEFPAQAFRDRIPAGEYKGSGEGQVGFFVGCGMDLMCPESAFATLTLLKRAAGTVHVLDNCCCGLPAETYGDLDAARRLAEKNLDTIASERFDTIVTDCASCAAHLRKYPELFAKDESRRAAAEAFASRLRDVVQLWSEQERPVVEARDGCAIATYHDPCHAVRGQGLQSEPRAILRAIPGIEYRELPEADWCCGGAGSYALSHYDLSLHVLDRKMANVRKTGANLLVTSCPACMVHLKYGVRRHALPVRVAHLTEVVTEALEEAVAD